MMNIFNSFDPSSFLYLMFMMLWMIPIMMKKLKGKMMIFKSFFLKFLEKEISPNMKTKNQMSSMSLFLSMFMMLSLMNMSGLTPSSFSLTSHMSLNLPLTIIMWMMTNMFSMMKKNKITLSHLVPTGTPLLLSPFMTMIEMISNFIRPITLSVRLTANMVAGHILISLMEEFVLNFKPNLMMSFLMSSILMMLEMGVSIIQSYVFTILVTLYFSENH